MIYLAYLAIVPAVLLVVLAATYFLTEGFEQWEPLIGFLIGVAVFVAAIWGIAYIHDHPSQPAPQTAEAPVNKP